MESRSSFALEWQRITEEVCAAMARDDRWLLLQLTRQPDRTISLGADTVFAGFQDSRELRGPHWRTLADAWEFSDVGYSWVIAGERTAFVFFRQLLAGNVPEGVFMHADAIQENLLTVCRPCHDAIHRGEIDVTDLVIEVQVKRTTRLLEAMSDNDANGSGADDDEHSHRAGHRNRAFARSFVHSGSPYIPHSPKPIGKDVGFVYQQKKGAGSVAVHCTEGPRGAASPSELKRAQRSGCQA